ncbi:MAG: hypothetical protein HQK54_06070 [Oligoflexales bacterium]|nr:hypothetical protein [Oligoflexales bacterium]
MSIKVSNFSIAFLFFQIPLFLFSSKAHGIFLDGKGHYSLLGETMTHPGFDPEGGYFQAIIQNFRLESELRASDKSSFFVEFNLFENPRKAYLGDTPEPKDCSIYVKQSDGSAGYSNLGKSSDCKGRPQNTISPAYEKYAPHILKAYAKYATDYCIIDGGRRGRDWGMGAYLNSGKGLFDTDQSVFDGVTCNVNIQKTQTLGFSVGYDKLQETGSSIWGDNTKKFGAKNPSDDIDQYFFTIEYDDRKAKAGASFTQHIGFYFANIQSGELTKTDIKIADLYLGFFLPSLIVENEMIFRLGRSADPSVSRYGGTTSIDDDVVTNNVQSIASTGSLEYIITQSGSSTGPKEYNQGNFKSHSLFFDYAFAPGDSNGYQPEFDGKGNKVDKRHNAAEAMAFHKNYSLALMFFNDRADDNDRYVDGIFDPSRIMNASLFGFGYRYQNQDSGNFEIKLITGRLNEKMPETLKELYQSTDIKPSGYYGRTLGYELDIKYEKAIAKEFRFGFAGGIALPGKAWRVHEDQGSPSTFLIQGFSSFLF